MVYYKNGYQVEKMKGYSINPNKDLTLDIDELWIHIETDQNTPWSYLSPPKKKHFSTQR